MVVTPNIRSFDFSIYIWFCDDDCSAQADNLRHVLVFYVIHTRDVIVVYCHWTKALILRFTYRIYIELCKSMMAIIAHVNVYLYGQSFGWPLHKGYLRWWSQAKVIVEHNVVVVSFGLLDSKQIGRDMLIFTL